MGRDSQKDHGAPALFEITVTWHPHALLDYFYSPDGFWRQLLTLGMTTWWVVSCACLQMSLAEYFPELPLYPVPVMLAYLSAKRSPGLLVLAAFATGLVFDALAFKELGVTAVVSVLTVLAVEMFFAVNPRALRSFWQRSMLCSGLAAIVFTILKLLWSSFSSSHISMLSLFPKHCFGGMLIAALFLGPLMGTVMDSVEWIARITPRKQSKPSSEDDDA